MQPSLMGEVIDLLPNYATVGSLNPRVKPLLVLTDKEQLRPLQAADTTISSLHDMLEWLLC